ncbi:ABC transporter ATP-binding protein [Candidatus Harpocratesius sp.]
MVRVELRHVSFIQNKVEILHDINLIIEDQEYITIVGPTGAGKTSLVGLLSGLYQPTEGQILFDGVDITHFPPYERHCGVMFESYALFPHLTVLDNICYARHMHESNHTETYAIGEAVLELVRLEGRGSALPHECSGGMQQRIALARAIMALEQKGLLILDEPFKALDAGLRMNLRREVRKIAKSKELQMTTVHVTNDMQEAMMGDRIVVLDQGRIRQIGTPQEILYEPIDLFVANFFSTEMNYFNGKVVEVRMVEKIGFKGKPLQRVVIQTKEGFFLFAKTERHFEIGDKVTFLIRSQYFQARHKRRQDKTNSIVGKVNRVKFMGAWLRIEMLAPYQLETFVNGNKTHSMKNHCDELSLEPPKKLIKIEIPTTRVAVHNFQVGETITIYYPSQYVIVFPQIPQPELEAALRVN